MNNIHRKNREFQNHLAFQKMQRDSRNAIQLYKLTRLLESLPEARRAEILGLLAFVADTVQDGSSKQWLGQLLNILQTEVKADA